MHLHSNSQAQSVAEPVLQLDLFTTRMRLRRNVLTAASSSILDEN